MSLNPKGTSAGGGSQGTCKCGYPPGEMVTEPYSRKPKAQNQMNPGMRKTGHRNTMSLNIKVTSAGREARTHATVAIIQVNDNCQGYTTLQGQCRQGTEPYSGKLKAQNQDNLRMRQTGHRHIISLNPKATTAG